MRSLNIAALVRVIVTAFICFHLSGCDASQPSDESLERLFKKNRPELERLVAMMDEDWQMACIAPNFLWKQDNFAWPRDQADWGISPQRWQEYKNIFTKAQAKDGLSRAEKSSDILISVWSWGIVPAGTTIGYRHCGAPRNGYTHTAPPCTQQKDTGSGMYGASTSFGYRYKKMMQDWYILEQSN